MQDPAAFAAGSCVFSLKTGGLQDTVEPEKFWERLTEKMVDSDFPWCYNPLIKSEFI